MFVFNTTRVKKCFDKALVAREREPDPILDDISKALFLVSLPKSGLLSPCMVVKGYTAGGGYCV